MKEIIKEKSFSDLTFESKCLIAHFPISSAITLKIFISTENDNKNYLRIMYDVRVQMRQKEIRWNVLMQAINSS